MTDDDKHHSETFQEALVREDERQRVIDEITRESSWDTERSKAGCALTMLGTMAVAVALPLLAAIFGAAWWVFRVVSGAPTPW